jgi:hypothetical protein
MPRPLAPAVRDRILALLAEGQSCRAIARAVGCSISTVSGVAAADGFSFERSRTKKAAAATRDYAQANRLALLNRGFEKAGHLLDTIDTSGSFQQWTVAVAVLIDKRRLEDGEATSRSDVVSTDARDRLASRLDELSARRDAHRAAG